MALNWWGVFVPAGTPQPVVQKLNADLVKVLADADLKKRYADLGVEPVSSTPQFLADFMKAEAARYGKLIKEAGTTGN